ncbi:MAG: hypothetical protein V4574_03825 [Pseudomonadota bacterium]
MPFANPTIATIVAFLERIGIPVIVEPVPEDSLLPGATVRRGALVFDPERLPYPGDLLHEAGHIAVTDPAVRGTLDAVADDPGEEMAAIAWSYAAALEIGVDPGLVLHEHGYRGDGASILANFEQGKYFGVPLLGYFGMTAEAKFAEARGMEAYPRMARWLR